MDATNSALINLFSLNNFLKEIFLESFMLPVLGAIFGGILTDLIIRKRLDDQERKRSLENLKGDLKYNLTVNKEVKRISKEYAINIAHYIYATEGVKNFVYKKASNRLNFPYKKLFKLLVLLESSNKLLRAALYRADSGRHVIVENSIKSNTEEIEKVLKEIMKSCVS